MADYKSKTVLVTGAAGFIGYHLCKRLRSEGFRVIGIDNLNDYYDVELKKNRLRDLGLDPNADSSSATSLTFYKCDLRDLVKLNEIAKSHEINYIVHLAAQAGVRYSLSHPHKYMESNGEGFLNIIEIARNYRVEHFVYASSSSVYGLNSKVPFSENHPVDHPISLYAATKRANELMAHTYSHLYNIPTTGLRFFTVYGPWGRPDMAIYIFAKKILANQPIAVFNNGEMMRDFTYVDDIVEGVKRVMLEIPKSGNQPNSPESSSAPYKIYNIGRGKPLNLMDFIKEIELCIGKEAIIDYQPIQDGDVVQTFANTRALQESVGYTPEVSHQEGVKKFVDWYKSYHLK